jgi:dGTPase
MATAVIPTNPFRLGESHRNSGLGATVLYKGKEFKVRQSDLYVLGYIGASPSEMTQYYADIERAQQGDKVAQERLWALEEFANFISDGKFKNYTRLNMELIDRKTLSALAALSIGSGIRLRHEDPDPNRTAFYRDFGRIIHCRSFRNLAGKTQVFAFPSNPTTHTRLFHSIKVAQLAESIGQALGLNINLIWAIGLAHDLGHTPFGHAGEEPLQELGQKYFGKDYVFKHNRQSVRLLMELEKYWKDYDGLNMHLLILDGVLRHNGEDEEYVLTPRESELYRNYMKSVREGKPIDISPEQFMQLLDLSHDDTTPLTYEGCLVRLCDRIAYIPVDLEDAIMNGFLVEEHLPDKERRILNKIRYILGQTTSKMFNTMIIDVINKSRELGTIAMSERIGNAMVALQKFNYRNICFRPEKKEFEARIPFYFRNLFKHYLKIENLSPQQAIDKIATMTDQQVVNDFDKHFGLVGYI